MRLVLDWDGTVTERDTLELVIESFGDMATYRRTGSHELLERHRPLVALDGETADR